MPVVCVSTGGGLEGWTQAGLQGETRHTRFMRDAISLAICMSSHVSCRFELAVITQ